MADEKELSEDTLFDDATSDAPVEEAAAEPVVEEQSAQARDEAGRFAAKAEAETESETVAASDQPARTPVDDNAAMVPSWRVREINEEKRAATAELEALRAERAQWQQRQQQPAPKAEPVAKADKPDPLLDPEGYAKAVREEVRNDLLNERREESLVRAREANQPEFDEAYAAAQKAVDPALKARMQNSRDPGKTLLEWHREVKTRQEIGGDLNAYKQRLRDEALKDPEFLAKAVEAARGTAQPQQSNGRPRVELPPSLNGASRSNAALRSAMTADVDDEALFEQTTA
jgi:hypothetical protein